VLDSFSAHTVAAGDAEAVPRLDPSRTALLVVDMLNDFCEPGGAMVLPDAERLYGPIAALVGASRACGAAVVWVCDRHEAETDAEFRKRTPHCLVGTWGAEIVSALPVTDGEAIVIKRRFSGFFDTDLEQRLRDGGRDQLVVCGVVTNICVRSTVHDAFFRDFDVYVPADACAATGEREQESTLYDIGTHFGTVTDVASVVTALGRAG
jgi:ureidoacrylate peracid hydrolase